MGVSVVEVAGWRTRGSTTFAPVGAGHHHTAGSSRGATPSLNTCIFGRPDVPGPLSQVLQSREPNPADDKAYVIAAGKANHGGVGVWRGVSGNSKWHGLEVEHVGTGPVDPRRHEVSCRILAAMLQGTPNRDPAMVWEHYEYAQPPGRKIDFYNLNPPFGNRGDGIRARVAQLLRPTPPPPPPTPLGGLDMASFFFKTTGKEWRLYDSGVVMDLPYESSSAVANEFIQAVDLATKHLTGKILLRRNVSPACYAYITAAAQSKAGDAPGFVAKVRETGKRVWVTADRSGKISEEHSPDDFAAIVWVLTSQGYDLTPQTYSAEQLDGIPELSTEAPDQAEQPVG
jgi:hypothetical protein